eukprot:jgi/Chrzof1/13832/Cz08g14070.t1
MAALHTSVKLVLASVIVLLFLTAPISTARPLGSNSARRLLANGGAGASGGNNKDGAAETVNQLSVTRSADAVNAAALANSIAATTLAADSAVASAQRATKTATSGLIDGGRRLLANGGAGASGGNNKDGAAETVNQLSVTRSADAVNAAALANSIAATTLAADSAVASAQRATKTATSGLVDGGR